VLQHIERLQREIAELDDCDESTRRRLEDLAAELEETIEGDTGETDWGDLAEQVKSHLEQFEVDHPVLTRTVDRIVTTLNNMGI
jgi:chaperonin cofactor prefoldin